MTKIIFDPLLKSQHEADTALTHHAMCVVSREQRHAHEEMNSIQASKVPLSCYPKEFPLFSTRLLALNTALKTSTPPQTLVNLAQECELSRDDCVLMRKHFSKL